MRLLLDFEEHVIYEIKPAGREREGQAQVNYYVERANIELGGGPWRGVVVTYDRDAAEEYLASIGVFGD